MFLTPDEVADLTGKVRRQAQCEALRQMGIPFKIRPNGSLAVLTVAMEASFGHASTKKGSPSPKLRLPSSRGRHVQ